MRPQKETICLFYRRMVRLFFAPAVSWLFVSSLLFTNYVVDGPSCDEVCRLCPDTTLLQCSFFSLLCLILFFFIGFRSEKPLHNRRNPSGKRLALILLGGLLAGFWVLTLRPVPRADARSVQAAAFDLSAGQLNPFQPGEYMYIYPHQSGLLLLHLLLQKINPDTTLPFQFLNVFCYMGILYLLGELAEELGLGSSGCLAATCIGIVFLPLLLYVTFVYGTIPGLCFSLASLVLSIRFCRDAKWYQAVLAVLFLFLAVLIKSNYQIFAIGLLLYVLYNSLQDKRHCWGLLVMLLPILPLAGKLPIFILEKWTGCSLHNGISAISWVAMGLRTGGPRGPGWYDKYTLKTYFSANLDPKAQSAVALDCISGIFRGYLMDPKSMVRFFVSKNATQWSDPLFQGIWLNRVMQRVSDTAVPQWVDHFLRLDGPNLLSSVFNLLQTLVYGGLVLWAWMPTNETRKSQEDLLAVILVGGFVFHTFWEAKSQYTLPYYVLIFPLALLGYRRLSLLQQDPNARLLWKPITGKLRFLMPVLLMLLALLSQVFWQPH